MSGRLRVLVADSAPTRLAVRMTLVGIAEMCAEAQDRAAAVGAATLQQPDVCLIGRSLPGGGIEAVSDISELLPGCAIVVLGDAEDASDLVDAVRAGAIGYLPVGFTSDQLQRAIEGVRVHQAAIPRSMVRELINEIRFTDRTPDAGLSSREAQVLRMLSSGQSTSTIASSLEISPVTVRRHISALVRKLGVSGRAELVAAGSETVGNRWAGSRSA